MLIAQIKSGTFTEVFSEASTFKADIDTVTDKLTINPVAYINKVVVTNPKVPTLFSNPYTQSLYSGLIYNNYA